MPRVTNIAAYQFAELTDLRAKRESLLRLCRELSLKGSILLSPEGINLFVSGERSSLEGLLHALRQWPGLESLTAKFSESEDQPFRRMLVRLKKEIIAFGVEGIQPGRKTSPKLSPKALKQWLDEGRPVTLLDTRNDYEVKLGTFKGAKPIGVRHFRDFPEAVRQLPESMKQEPIVMFCTGGIRCEKAGPFMEREGFSNLFQLEGGILKYFEECGGAHYEGECFVFDQRVGVDASLAETDSTQCFHCLTPLTAQDQAHPHYDPPRSCPYCFQTSEQALAETLNRRHAALARLTDPLPGSQPYDNYRPIHIPADADGLRLLDFLSQVFKHVPEESWLRTCEAGRILDSQRLPAPADRRVKGGEQYYHWLPSTVEPEVSRNVQIVYEDEVLIVVNKPAPLPLHPSGRFNRNTLQSFLQQLYAPQKPKPAHRLDANTSGLVVFTRTRRFAGLLQPQFASGEVEKVYCARVLGHPSKDVFESDAPIRQTPGELGSRDIDVEGGAPARTEFRVLSRDADGTSLLEVRPKTGRTNQIRVHLWDLGFPILGDPVYKPGKQLGSTQTLSPEDAPLCLHSWRLSFRHPLSGLPVTYQVNPPQAWAGSIQSCGTFSSS